MTAKTNKLNQDWVPWHNELTKREYVMRWDEDSKHPSYFKGLWKLSFATFQQSAFSSTGVSTRFFFELFKFYVDLDDPERTNNPVALVNDVGLTPETCPNLVRILNAIDNPRIAPLCLSIEGSEDIIKEIIQDPFYTTYRDISVPDILEGKVKDVNQDLKAHIEKTSVYTGFRDS